MFDSWKWIKMQDYRQNMLLRVIFVAYGHFAQNFSDSTQFGLSALIPIVWKFWFRNLKIDSQNLSSLCSAIERFSPKRNFATNIGLLDNLQKKKWRNYYILSKAWEGRSPGLQLGFRREYSCGRRKVLRWHLGNIRWDYVLNCFDKRGAVYTLTGTFLKLRHGGGSSLGKFPHFPAQKLQKHPL